MIGAPEARAKMMSLCVTPPTPAALLSALGSAPSGLSATEAAARLLASRPDARFVWCGGGFKPLPKLDILDRGPARRAPVLPRPLPVERVQVEQQVLELRRRQHVALDPRDGAALFAMALGKGVPLVYSNDSPGLSTGCSPTTPGRSTPAWTWALMA